MKRLLLLTLVISVAATTAFAQGGIIGTYGDANGTDCNVVAPSGVFDPFSVYVVHTMTGGAKAVQFAMINPECVAGIYSGWATTWGVALGDPVVGNPTATPPQPPGASIGYGGCNENAVILVGQANFLAAGATPPCCLTGIIAHQGDGILGYASCADVDMTDITGAAGTINGNETCSCASPTANSTWGGIKSLYK